MDRIRRRRWSHPDRAAVDASERRVRDAGVSLIEVVVTIVLIGVVILPILEAVRTATVASTLAQEAAQVETALVNAADRVNRAPKRCDYSIYAEAAVLSQGWQSSQATLQHQYYVPPSDLTASGGWVTGTEPFAPGCAGVEPTDLLVQRVVITVTGPSGRISRSIEVVKSDI